MHVTIERCALSDLAQLREISIETFVDTFAADNTEEDMANYLERSLNAEKLADELNTDGSFFYFIRWDGELAGYLKCNMAPAQTEEMGPDTLEVERIYIRTAYKRRGLGRQLIDFAIASARESGKKAIWLGVWEHNYRAQEFYRALGFERAGSHSFFMGEDEQTDYIMTKRLGN